MDEKEMDLRAPAVVWLKDYAYPIVTEALYRSEEEAREFNGADFILWPYKTNGNGFIVVPAERPYAD